MSFLKRVLGGRLGARRPETRLPEIAFSDQGAVSSYQLLLENFAEIFQIHPSCQSSLNSVRTLQRMLKEQDPEFGLAMTSAEIWGGSGSFSDWNFKGLDGVSPEAANLNNHRLELTLVELAKRLKRDGMYNPRIESLGELYEKWSRDRRSMGGE